MSRARRVGFMFVRKWNSFLFNALPIFEDLCPLIMLLSLVLMSLFSLRCYRHARIKRVLGLGNGSEIAQLLNGWALAQETTAPVILGSPGNDARRIRDRLGACSLNKH